MWTNNRYKMFQTSTLSITVKVTELSDGFKRIDADIKGLNNLILETAKSGGKLKSVFETTSMYRPII